MHKQFLILFNLFNQIEKRASKKQASKKTSKKGKKGN